MSKDPRTPDGRPPEEQPLWRRDFPVDVPEDQLVARRDFAKFMVLISGAFAAGQTWIAVQNLLRKGRGAPEAMRIADVAAVRPGEAKPFHYPTGHDPCLLVRLENGRFVAYGSQCTHLMCAVLPDVPAGKLHCPCHNGHFDLHTGDVTAGPPRRPLPRILLEQRDGAVYAVGVELRPS